MKLESRKYETESVVALGRDLAKHRRVLAVAPTGAGKTVIAAMLVERGKWRRVLWLAHRYELIDQAFTTLSGLGLDAGILMAQEERLHGGDRVNARARVQVASVQTIARRGAPSGVDLIVFDEAHRVMADSYQSIATASSRAHVLGVTATPCRMDGKGLGEFFQYMRVMAKPSDLYGGGYLAQPRVFSAPPDVLARLAEGLKGAKVVHGDYTPSAIAKAVDHGLLVGRVVSESLRIAPGVPKVVFAGSVRHSHRIVREFIGAGVAAAHLDGKMAAKERDAVLRGLRSGSLEVVSNVDVLSEGWDLPSLGAVVIARPTKSLARFLQMAGRVQRTFGRKKPVVLDHGSNVQRFDILPGQDIEWTLEQGAGHVKDEEDPKHKECSSCFAMMSWGATECPECGCEHVATRTPREEREELEIELQHIDETRMAEIRMRVTAIAKKKNAPPEWAERVSKTLGVV